MLYFILNSPELACGMCIYHGIGNSTPPPRGLGPTKGGDSLFRGIPARWLKISLHMVFPRVFPRVFRAVVIKALPNPVADIMSDW